LEPQFARLDALPARLEVLRHGVEVDTVMCLEREPAGLVQREMTRRTQRHQALGLAARAAALDVMRLRRPARADDAVVASHPLRFRAVRLEVAARAARAVDADQRCASPH